MRLINREVLASVGTGDLEVNYQVLVDALDDMEMSCRMAADRPANKGREQHYEVLADIAKELAEVVAKESVI